MKRVGPSIRAAAMLVVGATLVTPAVIAPATGSPVGADPAADTAASGPAIANTTVRTNPTLALVEQTFVVEVDGRLRLHYELVGEVDGFDPDDPPTTTEPPATDEPANPEPTSDDSPPTEPPATDEPTSDDPAPTEVDGDGDVDPDDDREVDAEPAGPIVEVVVTSYEPVELRDDVPAVLRGRTGLAVDGARFLLSEVLAPDDDTAFPQLVLDIQTSTRGDIATELELPIPGLYPITVDLVSDGRRVARHITFAERLPAPGARPARSRPFSLAIVAGIPDPGPEPAPLDLVDARSRLLEVAQLGEALASPLNVSIPPVVARSAAGDPELADRLNGALVGDEVLAAPEMRLDPSSAVAADEVDAFTRELREGEDVLGSTFPATARQRSAWLVTESLSSNGAAMLRDLGVQLLVMPLDHYHRLEGSLPPAFTDPSMLYTTMLPNDRSLNVAVIDPVSALLDPQRADGRTTAETAVAVFAELTATRLQLSDANRLAILSAPSFAVPDADVLGHLEQMVADHPAFDFQRMSFIASAADVFALDGSPVDVVLPTSAGPDITARSLLLATTRLEVATIASMLPPDDPRPAEWNADLDLWLSTALSTADIESRVSELVAEVEAIPDRIVQPEPFTFTLTGDTSDITIRLTNTGDTALSVVLVAEASKLTFPDGDVELTLQPGINTITIPVRTRSNGTFPVTIELVTPSGNERIGEPLVLTARVNALNGLGQVLTGGALVVLLSWWLSHLRSRRRRQLESAEQTSRRTHPAARTAVTDPADTVASP